MAATAIQSRSADSWNIVATHLEENVAAAGITLPDELFQKLSEVNPPPASLR
ncbi:MAG: hypothetical protein ABSG62_16420 [Terracidiphilus sp.]|jgi:hypothetical protein